MDTRADIYQACPATDEQAAQEVRDGGVVFVLPEPRAKRLTCLLESCDAYRAERARQDTLPLPAWGLIGALVLGLLGGFALTWFLLPR